MARNIEMASSNTAWDAVAQILGEAWNACEGKDKNGRVCWGTEVTGLVQHHLDDLSMSSAQHHGGDAAKITDELVAVGRAPIANRPEDIGLEEWGRQLKNAVGALWGALEPRKGDGGRLSFPATVWWTRAKRASARDAAGKALGNFTWDGENSSLAGGPEERGRDRRSKSLTGSAKSRTAKSEGAPGGAGCSCGGGSEAEVSPLPGGHPGEVVRVVCACRTSPIPAPSPASASRGTSIPPPRRQHSCASPTMGQRSMLTRGGRLGGGWDGSSGRPA